MTVLQVADLRFGYAGDVLFENVTFSLALGERAALVAPNGAGKTTLLKLIARELEPDGGSVVLRREATLGFSRQSHELGAEGDVMGAFLAGFGEIVRLRDALRIAQEGAARGDAASLDRLSRAIDEYHAVHGDELEHKVASIAHRLGFTDADLARPVASLSGGERGRLHLGVTLAQEPDLLLLDEPTNHLDLDTIAWLEGYLAGYRGAVLIVSHDRAFLDNVCPITLELGSRGLRSYPCRYSVYIEEREEDLERERALLERQEQLVAKTEDFIRKNIAGQKTKQAQSRRKMLEKLERLERPEDVWDVADRVAFRFAPAARSGDIVLDARGLGAERGGRVLFDGVELLVRRGERIGIVGPNGSGKTTLLRLLAGRGEPGDRGSVKRGTNLQDGFFDQHLGAVDPALTAVENVRAVRGDFTVEAARQYLARFRFWGDDPLRVVSGFSGGERSRLALAKLLLEPRNLLFLDEPTNHLDIPAAEILEEALVGGRRRGANREAFEGTVLLVSHDRRFLENVTTRVVSVRDGKVEIYPGGFRDYAASHAPRAEERAKSKPPPPEPPAKRAEAAQAERAAEAKRQSFEAQRQQARALEKKKRRVQELEQAIAKCERELDEMRGALKSAPGDDWEKLAKLAQEEQALTKKVDAMLVEWAAVSEEVARPEGGEGERRGGGT
jgi:ATP-binding cassette, subfamily F, member 3